MNLIVLRDKLILKMKGSQIDHQFNRSFYSFDVIPKFGTIYDRQIDDLVKKANTAIDITETDLPEFWTYTKNASQEFITQHVYNSLDAMYELFAWERAYEKREYEKEIEYKQVSDKDGMLVSEPVIKTPEQIVELNRLVQLSESECISRKMFPFGAVEYVLSTLVDLGIRPGEITFQSL